MEKVQGVTPVESLQMCTVHLHHSTMSQEGRLHQWHHSRKWERHQEAIQDIQQHHWKYTRKPEAESNKELANSFADFFIQKVQKIRDSLEHHPKYDPSKSTTRLREVIRQFREVSEDEVKMIINRKAIRSCESYPIPTSLLKQILQAVI